MSTNNMVYGLPSIEKPWLKYYSKDAINAHLPECTIYEYLLQNNKNYPSDIAIIYLGRKITYRELFENINKTAASFLKAGVIEKEIVTVALPSIPETLYCVYALNKIGAVANMIHPLAGTEETINYFNEVKSRIAVIFDGAYGNIVTDICRTSVEKVIVASPADSLPLSLKTAYNVKKKKPKLDGNVFVNWKSFIQDGYGTTVKEVKRDCHDMAIISHTGGTTGEPKGVMCSDYNINALIWQLSVLPNERQERNLVVLPPFINYSLVDGMLGMIALGIQTILIPDYRPEKIVEYIRKYRPNHLSSIPMYWEPLLSIKGIRKDDFTSLRHIYYGGEAMSIENENAVNEILINHGAKSVLHKGLGATELVSAATMTYDDCNTPGSVGVPLPKVNCKIVEIDTEREMGYNQQGEICFSGPTLMLGYYENDEATKGIIHVHEDGLKWLHTGDVGYIDENGIIYITDRIKRILGTKGRDGQPTKMFPDRIEKAIYNHSGVELCCVVGIPDIERINYPKAYVTLKQKSCNESDKRRIEKEIVDICKQNLPDYMVPDEIEIIDDLPRTPRGKIDYRSLEERSKHNNM